MLRVEIADVSADWAVLGSTRRVPDWSALLVWEDPWPHVGAGGYSYAVVGEDAHPGLERPWFEYLVPAAELEQTVGRAPARRHPGRRGAAHRGLAAPAGARKPTTRPSRTSWTCCAPPCTWPRAATRARRPSPACTTWATRRGAWCSSSSTARSTPCPPPAAKSVLGRAQSGHGDLRGAALRNGPRGPGRHQALRRPGRSTDRHGRRGALHRRAGSDRGSRRRAGRGAPDRIPEGDPHDTTRPRRAHCRRSRSRRSPDPTRKRWRWPTRSSTPPAKATTELLRAATWTPARRPR